jgi:hypothetical protein
VGSELIERRGLALLWETIHGQVAVFWARDDAIGLLVSDISKRLPGVAVVVNVDPDFDDDGPTVRAVNAAAPDLEYGLRWGDLPGSRAADAVLAAGYAGPGPDEGVEARGHRHQVSERHLPRVSAGLGRGPDRRP